MCSICWLFPVNLQSSEGGLGGMTTKNSTLTEIICQNKSQIMKTNKKTIITKRSSLTKYWSVLAKMKRSHITETELIEKVNMSMDLMNKLTLWNNIEHTLAICNKSEICI